MAEAIEGVISCLEGMGSREVNQEWLFLWQDGSSPDELEAREAQLTEAEKALINEIVEPTHQCAEQLGVYELQEATWIAEIERLMAEDPETAQPLLDMHLLEALRQEGIHWMLSWGAARELDRELENEIRRASTD